jgi:DNA-binding NtrC family response regulator
LIEAERMACRIVLVTRPSPEGEVLCSGLVAKGREVVRLDPSEVEARRPAPQDILLALGADPVETCEALLLQDPRCAVVVLDDEPSIDRAVAALRAGAADFVTEPADIDAVDAAIQRVIERRMPSDRSRRLGSLTRAFDDRQQGLVGDSIVMRQVRSRIERLKGSDSTVLITGESGTGRDAVGRILHEQSQRRNRSFVSVSCATLSGDVDELFERLSERTLGAGTPWARAAGGTLFLDEVERLPPAAQAKLQRTLDTRGLQSFAESHDGALEPRLIATSNVDLADEVAAGRFKEALFDRLSAVEIRLPPLRERGLDTLLLAQHFVRRFARASGKEVVGMTLGAARMLMAHDWPGNVRELGTWVEAAVALAAQDHITESELLSNWGGVRGASDRSGHDDTLMSWNSLEARHIASVLEEAGGNKARAARLLGIDRKTLYRKLERYGLDATDRQRRAH